MPLKTFVFPSPSRWAAAVAFAFGVLLLGGCATEEPKEAVYVERPVEEIYNEAWIQVERRVWVNAAKQFDEVERQHPYSVWARRAMLMAAFCYYEGNKYTEAIAAADRFIQLHPGNKDVAYAYYLRAMSLYEQITDVGRDQRKTEEALASLLDVAQRFPTSEYARAAQLKIDLTRDHLAGKEMSVGRYYLFRGQYVAAINRFRTVVQNYQTTTHTAEALHRLTETYLALGIASEAQTAAAVLGHNYAGSEWYQDSYAMLTGRNLRPAEDKGSWISRAFTSVF